MDLIPLDLTPRDQTLGETKSMDVCPNDHPWMLVSEKMCWKRPHTPELGSTDDRVEEQT